MMETVIDFITDGQCAGQRMDQVVAAMIPEASRRIVADLIRCGAVRVEGKRKKPGYRLKSGECVAGVVVVPDIPSILPGGAALDVIHEDNWLLVLNKAAGLVVHPAPGHWSDTLVNALLAHCPAIEGVGDDPLRPGIVHRLDKDTSGIMVVAKTPAAHAFLKQAFLHRRVEKHYLAMVSGEMDVSSGTISLPIGRHPVKRKMMAVTTNGRAAVTVWKARAHCPGATLVEADLKTGRTHQIRVHFKALGHPLLGDSCYGRRINGRARKRMSPVERGITRQMLHAWKIGFRHPWSGRRVEFSAPLAADMKAVVQEYGVTEIL